MSELSDPAGCKEGGCDLRTEGGTDRLTFALWQNVKGQWVVISEASAV